MNGDFRDPIDRAIAHDLSPLAPDDLDPDAVLGALRPTLQRARARRRLAVSSGALGTVVVLLGVGGLLVGSRPSHLNVRQHSTTLPVASSTTSTSAPTSTTSPSEATTTSPSDASTTTPGPPSTTGKSTEAFTKTYTAVGGSMTVTSNRTLTLDSYAAKHGYQVEIHTQKPDDIELRFTNGSHESRIRVRIENGHVGSEKSES